MAMEKPVWERDSFFKVMIGDFQRSMRVPPSFHKHLRGDLHVEIVLRNRGGRRWTVNLRRQGPDLFFLEGWECFIADLAIKLGEFLLFVYDGDLGFDVKIYGLSGCEKEDIVGFSTAENGEEGVPLAEELTDTNNTELFRSPKRMREVVNGHVFLGGVKMFKNDIALEYARSFKSNRPFFIATYRSSRWDHMTIPVSFKRDCRLGELETVILKDPNGRSWHVRIAHWTRRIALSTGWTKFKDENRLREGDVCVFEFFGRAKAIHVHIFRAKGSDLALGRKAGMYEKCKAETHEAKRSLIGDATFSCVCLKSRKYNLSIPNHILKENNGLNLNQTILRDPSGRSWSVQLRKWVDGRKILGKGWLDLCKANDIQEGDICAFELSDGVQLMDIKIIPVERAEMMLC